MFLSSFRIYIYVIQNNVSHKFKMFCNRLNELFNDGDVWGDAWSCSDDDVCVHQPDPRTKPH